MSSKRIHAFEARSAEELCKQVNSWLDENEGSCRAEDLDFSQRGEFIVLVLFQSKAGLSGMDKRPSKTDWRLHSFEADSVQELNKLVGDKFYEIRSRWVFNFGPSLIVFYTGEKHSGSL